MQETMIQGGAVQERSTGTPPWERVIMAPPAAWVEADSYDPSVACKEGSHLTHLLWTRQVEAESGVSYHSTAVRLETPLAVQHESQWSLDLDARAGRLILHWLRVVRGEARIDQLKRERMRLIQRETQLERHVIDGSWTLLIVLEDVRPGDVIEAAYSFEWAHPIRPEGCEVLFVVPPQATVGRYRLTVSSSTARADLRWKTSDDAPALREESVEGGRRRWVWEGAQPVPREAEPNQPSSFLDYIWVQVSDLAEWSELARRVEEAWLAKSDVDGLAEIPAFAKPETVDAAAIVAGVRQVQDAFRYLSINLETGGWIPSAPGEVARRRHGDCKDLAWLAATVLRSWGVEARPVLVGTGLRERVAALLPMAMVFNHAILEVEWAGEARWFDLTARDQGGDFATQAVEWFGQGLAIGGEKGGLRGQPGKRVAGAYALKETILLDTSRGGVSLVEARVRAEGWQADNLRRARLAHGAEAFAKDREEQAQRRYGRTRRAGELRWRDDRTRNVCELVEVFELSEAVYPGEHGQRALFDVPASLVPQAFALPADKPRRGPWDMPYPLEIAHEVTVKSSALGVGSGPRKRWSESEFEASQECSMIRGAWTKRLRFRVGGPEVTAERLPVYRRRLEELFRELGWRIYLPWGLARSRRGEGFGELGEEKSELVTGAKLTAFVSAAQAAPAASAVQTSSSPASPSVAASPEARAATEAKIVGSGGRRRRRSASVERRSGEFTVQIPSGAGRFFRRFGWAVFLALIAFGMMARSCLNAGA